MKLNYFCRMMSGFRIGHLGFWIQRRPSLDDPDRSMNSIQELLRQVKVKKLLPAFCTFSKQKYPAHRPTNWSTYKKEMDRAIGGCGAEREDSSLTLMQIAFSACFAVLAMKLLPVCRSLCPFGLPFPKQSALG